jgi:hypothetical protein
MGKTRMLPILVSLIFLSSCTPLVICKLDTKLPSTDPKQEIKVLGLDVEIPADAEILGTVKVGDTGFSIDCGYKVVIDKAKMAARNAGGNAIKITEHIPPGFSTCDRITARILRINDIGASSLMQKQTDSQNRDYAILNVYSVSKPGVLVEYNLHLGDSVICRVNNNLKTTIAIRIDGLNSIWAKTDAKFEIPIDIKFGHIYYLRCGVSGESEVNNPMLELVDSEIGSREFDIFNSK